MEKTPYCPVCIALVGNVSYRQSNTNAKRWSTRLGYELMQVSTFARPPPPERGHPATARLEVTCRQPYELLHHCRSLRERQGVKTEEAPVHLPLFMLFNEDRTKQGTYGRHILGTKSTTPTRP